MDYGLIGGKLGHSYSKDIHEMLADYTYDLCPLTKEEFVPFMEPACIPGNQCHHSLQTGCYSLPGQLR